MMPNRKAVLFGLLCFAQLSLCATLVVRWEIVMRRGDVFRFLSQPVDPFDAFRGRYVAIRVEQDHVETDGKPYTAGQTVYARLANDATGLAYFDELLLERPARSVPYLETRVSHVDDNCQYLPGDILDPIGLRDRILYSNDTASVLLRENLQEHERLRLASDDAGEVSLSSVFAGALADLFNRVLYTEVFLAKFFDRERTTNPYSDQRRLHREFAQAFPGAIRVPPAGRVFLDLPFDRFYMEESRAPRAESAYREHSRAQSVDRTTITVRIRNGLAVIENLWVGDSTINAFLQSAGARETP